VHLTALSNAFAERWVRSCRDECLRRIIPLGEKHLRKVVTELVEHYHRERNHQGLGNRLVVPAQMNGHGAMRRRERPGGTLSFYYREAA
jgi:putative transposase